MSMSKTNKTMLAAIVAAIVALGFVGYNMVGHDENAQAVAQTSTLRVATVSWSTATSGCGQGSNEEMIRDKISNRALLNNISDSKLTYTCSNVYASLVSNQYNPPRYAMQLGKGWWENNYGGDYAIGTITFNFSNFSYQSIRIEAKANETKSLFVNNIAYPVTTSWNNIDIYNCRTPSSKAITITSEKALDPFTWISCIELHY